VFCAIRRTISLSRLTTNNRGIAEHTFKLKPVPFTCASFLSYMKSHKSVHIICHIGKDQTRTIFSTGPMKHIYSHCSSLMMHLTWVIVCGPMRYCLFLLMRS